MVDAGVRWICTEAAASDCDAAAALWGRSAALHCVGGELVLCG